MAIQVEIPYRKTLLAKGGQKEVYSAFADLTVSISTYFPGVEQFEKTDGDTYRWLFEKIGYSSYTFQVELLTRAAFTPDSKIVLNSLPAKGLSQLKGIWTFKPISSAQTQVEVDLNLVLELPVPFMLKSVAAPIAQKEISKLFDRYVSNVEKIKYA